MIESKTDAARLTILLVAVSVLPSAITAAEWQPSAAASPTEPSPPTATIDHTAAEELPSLPLAEPENADAPTEQPALFLPPTEPLSSESDETVQEPAADPTPIQTGENDSTSTDEVPYMATNEAKNSPSSEAVSLEDDEEPQPRSFWNQSSMDWIIGGHGDSLGMFSLRTGPSWEFDLSLENEGLEIESGSAIHFVSGPGRTDLPPRLFDLFWNARFRSEIADGIGIDANFNLGLYTDFEDSVREGWRFPGRLLGYGELTDENHEVVGRLVGGIEYLDLEQTEILPAGGMIVQPNKDLRLDIYFPRPQLRLRIEEEETYDRWLYIRGEYYGSAWAIERVTGNADVVSLTEYRATLGFESVPVDSDDKSSFIEFSYLFNRDLEYRSGVGNFQPEDTLMIRMGSRF